VPTALLVTNDFPPRHGGIQSYLAALATHLPPGDLAVYAPAWPGAAAFDAGLPFPVHRHPTSLMLPEPSVARRAAALIREHGASTVWFGASAPLALLGPHLRRTVGVERVVASTHGHEVGWSMLPGARGALRRIGRDADVLTTVSRYTRGRVAAAFGPRAALEPLPPGIDTDRFRPDPQARAWVRRRHRLGDAPLVTCVSRLVARKGQDALIAALPAVRERVPGTRLLLVGDGPDAARLRRLAARRGVADAVVLTGAVPEAELPAHHAAGDVFALPCRTRGGGLDVEGLGIALLEAAASGLPVVAGAAGGAPETVRPGETGHVVDPRDPAALADVLAGLLADPARAAAMGAAGRAWMRRDWGWADRATRLATLLAGATTASSSRTR
jgi:phosphatidyl-myo-inositol dimannoside synthase